MKKIISLFVLAATLFSCTDSDDSVTAIPGDLQKVVFYSGTANERQWNINNNLLTNITLADGTVVEEFSYDSLNRVINDTKYTAGIVSEVTMITYNADNTIHSINGLDYTYDVATRTYAYSYSGTFSISCQVNSDMLAMNYIRTGTNPGEYHMTYTGGDMASFEKINSGSTEIIKNFHFDGTYGANTNPLYNAVLAVARVKSLTDPNFFIDSVASTGLAGGFDKGASDSNYYSYGMASSISHPATNTKDFSIGVEVLDSGNNSVGLYEFAEYYYN